LIGTVLDKYEVLQKVGEGGMATVYRGRHMTLDRHVAIKVLHPHLSSSTRNRKRFAREARAIEHLRHDNILEIFDYSGADAEDCYIVTEFVGGQTLSAMLDERGRFPSEVTALIGIALADALDYAHNSGVLHRDLKPDNVMVRDDGTVKLMDFGIARFLDESQVTMTGALVGSPAFMSPEQSRETDLDGRSDLFSLGTLLFYLSSGHRPFSGSNPSLILKNIIEGNRPQLADLAPSLSATTCDVVETLLQTDREDRYDTADQVRHDLVLALQEVCIEPTDPKWTLARFVHDPDSYTLRLEQHLSTVLLTQGRAMLEAGDHLTALRLLNRLLSVEEDNTEVLALVQGLHSAGPQHRPKAIIAFVAVVVAAVAAVVVTFMSGVLSSDATEVVEVAPEQPTPAALSNLTSDLPKSPLPVDPTPVKMVAPIPIESVPLPPNLGVPLARRPTRSFSHTVTALPPPVQDTDQAIDDVRPGCLHVRVSESWAKVSINGTPADYDMRARQDRCLKVPPGQIEVMLHREDDFIEEQTLRVIIAPGETKTIFAELTFRPIILKFPAERWADDCYLNVVGVQHGTLLDVGRSIEIPRVPDEDQVAVLTCDGHAVTQEYYWTEPKREVDFLPEGS
jgi:serine/threonine protein kinase